MGTSVSSDWKLYYRLNIRPLIYLLSADPFLLPWILSWLRNQGYGAVETTVKSSGISKPTWQERSSVIAKGGAKKRQ